MVETMVTTLALLHVGGALLYAAGYVGTNALTEIARHTDDGATLRTALRFSGLFDRRLNGPFATLTGLSGLALTAANGYAWTMVWVLLATGLFGLIVVLGIFVWAPYGRRIGAALEAGQLEEVHALLRARRWVALSRSENLLLAAVVVLMVVRPT